MTEELDQREIAAIAASFAIQGDFVDGAPYGSGHINDTYAINYKQAGSPLRYILQRINHNVFKQPELLQANIEKVTRHLANKLGAHSDASRRRLSLVPTHDGDSYSLDSQGNYWRVYLFIEGATTYDQIKSSDQAYQAARAFGQFVNDLSDIPERLEETIPDFHNTPARFRVLQQAIADDAHNRAADVKPEIDYVLAQEGIVARLVDLNEAGLIPERVTHNDTKLNNVMIDDETGEGICVIDLDTCMPGLSLYDFGDMVRTAARPTAEDEQDLDKVVADLKMFEALARGYIETLGPNMSPDERANLAFSAQLITLEIGIRFLTDYLQGDVYFKTHRPGHNIDRCRTQFKMAQEFERNMDRMNDFVERL
jgi:Ser/Thr protein kinase RdoA (MazF antagonist)